MLQPRVRVCGLGLAIGIFTDSGQHFPQQISHTCGLNAWFFYSIGFGLDNFLHA